MFHVSFCIFYKMSVAKPFFNIIIIFSGCFKNIDSYWLFHLPSWTVSLFSLPALFLAYYLSLDINVEILLTNMPLVMYCAYISMNLTKAPAVYLFHTCECIFYYMSMAKAFFNIVTVLVVASKILTVIDWPTCLVGLSAFSACLLCFLPTIYA